MDELLYRLEENSLNFYASGLIYCMEEMLTATHLSALEKHKESFLLNLNALRRHYNSNNYVKQIAIGVNAYTANKTDGEYPLNPLCCVCLKNPIEFDLELFYASCFILSFDRFVKYWRPVLINYKRRKAKYNRLQELIYCCKEYLKYARDNNIQCSTKPVTNAIFEYEAMKDELF